MNEEEKITGIPLPGPVFPKILTGPNLNTTQLIPKIILRELESGEVTRSLFNMYSGFL